MHDIDTTRLEYEAASDAFEFEFEGTPEFEAPLSEVEEMELAAELLTVSGEAELDQFLGGLFKKVAKGIGKIAKPLGGVLKGIAKKALPVVGGAVGSFIPIPGVGTAVGTALGTAASKVLEAELEGLSLEDQEFEVARRFVRLASTAARHAASTHPGADIRATVIAAVKEALQQQRGQLTGDAASPAGAAGIEELEAMAATPRSGSAGRSRSGRWIRRGGKIVLLGV